MDLFDKCKTDAGYFGTFRVQNDHFFSRPILSPLPGNSTTFQGKKHIQWSINNYLGLAESPEIKEVAIKAAEKWGASAPMGSRMLTGNTTHHIELEKKFAEYEQKESSIIFNYGYLGVLGTIASLIQENDVILVDKLSHASMLDATFMASGKFRVYKHNDMDNLESHLKRVNRNRKGGILIVTEGVFGMQGDLADLQGITSLKEKYDARLFVDDAHGFGVMGPNGRGVGAFQGVQDKIDIYFGTFAKTFAAIGGVTASQNDVVEWIRYNARTQVFAKSLPMIYVEVLDKALSIIRNDTKRHEKMWENAKMLKYGLRNLGYQVGEVPSPITPVYVPAGDVKIGAALVTKLREYGIFVNAVIYPVVPKGIILFRMIPTASHTEEDINTTIEAYRRVRDELGLKLSGS